MFLQIKGELQHDYKINSFSMVADLPFVSQHAFWQAIYLVPSGIGFSDVRIFIQAKANAGIEDITHESCYVIICFFHHCLQKEKLLATHKKCPCTK
jgi:hypothetical protein